MTNPKTHMGWTIGILAALLIGALSVHWSTLSEVPTMISIALGLSSLVLAMVAIFQSISAGSGLSQTLGKIDQAAQRTTEASSALNSAAVTLLSKASSIDNINPSLEALHQRFSDLVSAESRISNTASTAHHTTTTSSTLDQQEIYNLATLGFNVAVYIAKLSFDGARPFRLDELIPDEDYLQGAINGYLVSLRATRTLDMEYINGTILVKGLGPFTDDVIKDRMGQSSKTETFGRVKLIIDEYFARPVQ